MEPKIIGTVMPVLELNMQPGDKVFAESGQLVPSFDDLGQDEATGPGRPVVSPDGGEVLQRDQGPKGIGRGPRKVLGEGVHVDEGVRDTLLLQQLPDRRHHGEEGDPAGDQQLRCRCRLGDGGDRELRRRTRVGADGVGERALHRMAVDRDRAPVDQIPALGQMGAQRDDQGVRIRRRAVNRPRRLLAAVGVGDGVGDGPGSPKERPKASELAKKKLLTIPASDSTNWPVRARSKAAAGSRGSFRRWAVAFPNPAGM